MEYNDLTPCLDVVHSGPTSTDINEQCSQLYKELSGNQASFQIQPVVQGLKSTAGIALADHFWGQTKYGGVVTMKITALSGYEILDFDHGIISSTKTTFDGKLFALGFYTINYGPKGSFTLGNAYSFEHIAYGEGYSFDFDKAPLLNCIISGSKYYILSQMTATSSSVTSGSSLTYSKHVPGWLYGSQLLTTSPNMPEDLDSSGNQLVTSIDFPGYTWYLGVYYRASATGSLTLKNTIGCSMRINT